MLSLKFLTVKLVLFELGDFRWPALALDEAFFWGGLLVAANPSNSEVKRTWV